MPPKYLKYLLITILAACGFATQNSYGQDKKVPKELYIAGSIPDSLKENANAVVRYSDIVKTVKGPGKETIKYHTIVTILNEKGDHAAIMAMGYNKKYNTITGIEMHVYNANGDLIKKYHKSDMYDGAAGGDETLVTDERFLAVKHTIASYPITIEEEYEEDNISLVDLGEWNIQGDEQSVQNSYYHVAIDSTVGFRYLNKNTAIKPRLLTATAIQNIPAENEKTWEDSKSILNILYYSWKVSNLKAIKLEEGAESWRVLPRICFASNYFNFFGVPGNFSSWQSFGKWIQALNADVCSLSPERELEIRKMTDTIKTDKGKAKFLYNYMQQSMRYVSVQLGIGGLKPFSATFVDQKKYGDCKALSNYMSALLKAVNIPSCYAIINAEANQEPAEPSFPYNSFNHVILCVPFKGDTTWLECTSSTQPFGKLGPFTENRRALLITPDGGKLVNTPRSTMQDNQFNSEAHIILDADGGAKADVKFSCTGDYRDQYIAYSSFKLDEQKERMLHELNIRQPISFDIKQAEDKDGIKEIDLAFEYDKFCDVKAGDKQFYRPRAFDLVAFTLPIEEKRHSDYYFKHPMEKTCVTTIDLPAGFEVETLPVNQTLKFTYGNYELKYVYNASKNEVVSTAKFNLTNQVIPAAKYTELQQYLDAIAKAQNKKLVIHRKA